MSSPCSDPQRSWIGGAMDAYPSLSEFDLNPAGYRLTGCAPTVCSCISNPDRHQRRRLRIVTKQALVVQPPLMEYFVWSDPMRLRDTCYRHSRRECLFHDSPSLLFGSRPSFHRPWFRRPALHNPLVKDHSATPVASSLDGLHRTLTTLTPVRSNKNR